MSVLSGVEPKEVFDIFEKISGIPRGSGNEKAVSDFIANEGRSAGLSVYQDEACNVIIKKEGTEGYENSPTVMLQGHIDMVCEKDAETVHDFMKDGIKLVVNDEYVSASKTTLGADNGIAVAYMLAILKSHDIAHPPLEAVFTADEESGMSGARALDTSKLSGKRLINIDSEEEGHILSCCAGGMRASVKIPVEWECAKDGVAAKITIKGLKGGHSGADIHLQRANANKLMGRLVKFLKDKMDISFGELEGGNMDNAIPRESWATAVIGRGLENRLDELCASFSALCDREYRGVDDGITVETLFVEKLPQKVFAESSLKKVVAAITLVPCGVRTMSADIEGLVESSNNLGIMRTDSSGVLLTCALRSSSGIRKSLIESELREMAFLVGGAIETHGEYPAWEYNPNSELREIMAKTYKFLFGKDAKIDAIHAGLECGILGEKIKGLDMVSIGPDIENAHTPMERLSISSAERTWKYLKETLKNLK
ncbi:MAG: aminoacyl-histidine dipeptidase [Firmicutes bacterium]|nr:aminoacyl-histidine dipeptidase [Bacillota bacterium]